MHTQTFEIMQMAYYARERASFIGTPTFSKAYSNQISITGTQLGTLYTKNIMGDLK